MTFKTTNVNYKPWEKKFNQQYTSKPTTNNVASDDLITVDCSANHKTPASYELMSACNCSKLFPLVSGTATIINNIASALIAA